MLQEPDSEVVYQDEVWWSRLKQPELHSWSAGGAALQVEQLEKSKAESEPVAVSCYGGLRLKERQMLLRFVAPRPVSGATTAYLSWLAEELAKEGLRRVVVVWDNAPWHRSQEVRQWLRQHNRAALQARREGKAGIQIIPCWLPSKSPWLNPIEVQWAHGKRAVCEPARKLTLTELKERVHAYYKCKELALLDASPPA